MYLKTHFSYSYISSLNLPYFKKWYFYSELNVISNLDRQKEIFLNPASLHLTNYTSRMSQPVLTNILTPTRPNQMYI